MALHLSAVAAKDGTGTTIVGGVNFNDESGAGTGPFDQAQVVIDSTQNEILGTTAGAAVITDANGTHQQYLRGLVKLIAAFISAKITDGTNTAAVKAASTAPIATDPALVVSISPNSVNSNGRKTPANSAPVVAASETYATVAASQTAQGLGATGAVGDLLDTIWIIPATTSPGNVIILDSSTSITIFTGGASSVSNLVPFPVQLGAISANGQWKVTTGANVSAIATGNFT